MKKYYINELGYPLGYHKFNRHRLPQAYIELDEWYCLHWRDVFNEIKGDNNIIIIQTPTENELEYLTIANKIAENNLVFLTQESNIFDWFDWGGKEQELYINLLNKSKAFLYHNEYDKKVMKIFISNFIKYPGCINLFVEESRSINDGDYVLIPNPIKGYQRGLISHKLALESISDTPIVSTKYIRPNINQVPLSKIFIPRPDEYDLPNIKWVNRTDHDGWLNLIYNSKFGIDVHREFSGGNCSLEFGSLGIPLIGNINLDTQRDIFPDLSFDFLDYINIKKTIHLLLNDKDFYKEVSKKALDNTKKLYNSEIIVNQFKQDINKFI